MEFTSVNRSRSALLASARRFNTTRLAALLSETMIRTTPGLNFLHLAMICTTALTLTSRASSTIVTANNPAAR